MNKKYAILVLSCDKYSGLWKPFFSQFYKYWSNCPYQIYLGSNTKKYDGDQKVKTLLSGNYIDWSSNLLLILKQIPEEYIFIWLEDLFLTQKVEADLFQKSFRFMAEERANHIHFDSAVPPDRICNNSLFGIYEKKYLIEFLQLVFGKRRIC